jgi:hypothetical protein
MGLQVLQMHDFTVSSQCSFSDHSTDQPHSQQHTYLLCQQDPGVELVEVQQCFVDHMIYSTLFPSQCSKLTNRLFISLQHEITLPDRVIGQTAS